MDVLPWYNENQFRHYPLEANDALPMLHIVDAGFTWAATRLTSNNVNRVLRLTAIAKLASVLEFHILGDEAYVVNIPFDAADYTTYPVFKTAAATCSTPDSLSGTVTVADVPKLADMLQDGLNFFNILFDTACYDFVAFQATTKIRVANAHKRQSTNFGDCGIPRPDLFADEGFIQHPRFDRRVPVVFQQNCPTSSLQIVGGVNADVSVNTTAKQIRLAIGDTSTIPNCQEIPISTAEAEAILRKETTLSPQRCSQVITTVNGLPGPHVSLTGGPGVTIRKKDAVTLQIVLNDRTTGVCPGT